METDTDRYAFRPALARRKAVADGIFLGFGVFAGYRVAAVLPGFLERFEPERLGDIPLSVLAPAIVVVLAIGYYLRMFAVGLLESLKLLRSGRLATAAVTLDSTGITLEDGGTSTRFAWPDLLAATGDVNYFSPAQKPGRTPVRALVLRHRDRKSPSPAPDYRTKVAFVRKVQKPHHQFGAFDFQGLTIVPLAMMDPASAETLCKRAASLHRTATGA